MQGRLAEATNSQTLIVLRYTSPAPFTILAILDGSKRKATPGRQNAQPRHYEQLSQLPHSASRPFYVGQKPPVNGPGPT